MKYLYLRYLNFRLRLRQRPLASSPPREKSGHTPAHPIPHHRGERLDYIKIGLALIGVASMWLIFFLRQSAPVDLSPDSFSNVPPTPNYHTEHHE